MRGLVVVLVLVAAGPRQIAGAFAEIERLEVGLVAVQEIGKPDVFLREARRRLARDDRS